MKTIPPTHATAERNIVVLGDSIAAGYGLSPEFAWPELLRQRLAETYPRYLWRIHNLSVPGDATPDAYVRFDAVRGLHPDLLIIALGVNDCRRAYSPVTARRIAIFNRNEQTWWGRNAMLRRLGYLINPPPEAREDGGADSQVPMDAFLSILGWMARQARAMHALPAFVTMAPLAPTLASDPHFAPCPRYQTALRDLAREMEAALIEIDYALPEGAWQADGVHLTARGQAEIARRVFQNFRRPPIAAHLALQTQESNAHMAPSLD